jgi:hypothetical protein
MRMVDTRKCQKFRGGFTHLYGANGGFALASAAQLGGTYHNRSAKKCPELGNLYSRLVEGYDKSTTYNAN